MFMLTFLIMPLCTFQEFMPRFESLSYSLAYGLHAVKNSCNCEPPLAGSVARLRNFGLNKATKREIFQI